MRSAIVHDWLLSSIGGGEKVLEAMHTLFPSPIYTLLTAPKNLEHSYFEDKEIISSFIQKLPGATSRYRKYLPLFPLAIEQFDLSEFDLILSSSHCVAKGVMTHPDQLHICYCHTPMRYAWDLMHSYLKDFELERGVKGFFAKIFLHYLRNWDVQASLRVDAFVAGSRHVSARIRKFYRRESEVIYPPVDTSFFELEEKKEDFYVTASRLVPYKKIDLVVSAFQKRKDQKLIVIGDGPERECIRKKAGLNIEILGEVSAAVLKSYLQKAKAFIFPAVEDFGILPVEAMACGTPVIAFAKGGALETIIDGKTGVLFSEQTEKGLLEAMDRFEMSAVDPRTCRAQAERFSKGIFEEKFQRFVREKYLAFQEEKRCT